MSAIRTITTICNAAVLFIGAVFAAAPTMTGTPVETGRKIGTLDRQGVTWVSLADFFEALDCTWVWDEAGQQFCASRNADRFVFWRDISWYSHNGELCGMETAPQRFGAGLYAPLPLLLTIASSVSPDRFAWDSAKQLLTVERPGVVASRASRASKPPVVAAVNGGIRTIVIDPGHGGKDPGAIGPSGVREKDIVLAIALELRDLFKPHKDIKVVLTRETDEFIPLAERTRMANRQNADLFVSIHANATSGSKKKKETTTGYKVYFLSQAKNEEDKLAAMRENAVIELEEQRENYSSLQNVLIDLAGNEYLRESQELCILIDQTFETALKKRISRQDRGIGQANFWVLNGAYMPSILIETGFISNRDEEKMLQSKPLQKQMAKAIFEALMAFKKQYESGL